MVTYIKARIVKIGNSQGVRIPRVVLEQLRITADVEIEVRDDHLVLRPSAKPRSGWAEQFSLMAAQGDDQLLDPDGLPTAWDESEWEC